MGHDKTDLNEVIAYIAVTEYLNISAAAKALRISPATVSRRITHLESRLGVQLLDRSSRHIALTEVGRLFANEAARGLQLIYAAEEQVQQQTGSPQGLLRITAPTELIQRSFGNIAIEYAKQYPKVELHIIAMDDNIDMDEHELHIAIRAFPPSRWKEQGIRTSRELTQKLIGWMEMAICVSPDYLESHGPIEHPKDLAKHPCVVLGTNPSARIVHFRSPEGDNLWVEVPIKMFTTNVMLCRKAGLSGLAPVGLTWLDCRKELADGSLIQLFPEWGLEPVRCTAYFVDGPRPPLRIRAFLDMLSMKLPQTTTWL